MNYSLGNMLSGGGVVKRTISGFAYPQETLTAPTAGQWFIDGVAVSGQTGSTFVVPLLAYGRTITCGGSAPVVVWKPWDIAGVVSVRIADRGVLNAVSPDVAATDGQTVRRWNSLVGGFEANQTTGVSQPIWRATGQSNNPSVEFDGSNDRFSLSDNQVFRSAERCYAIAGFRNTNVASSALEHVVFSYGVNGSIEPVVSIRAKDFSIRSRRTSTASAAITAAQTPNQDYNVFTAECLFVDGVCRARLNGSQISTANYPDSLPVENATSSGVAIGDIGTLGRNFPGHICCVMLVNQLLSVTDRSRLERFAGLFGGRDIPLV